MRRGLLLMTAITFVTWIGTRMTAVALPLVALQETGQAWTTGLVGGAAGLPLLTVGWWGSRLRDRLTTGRALAVVMGVNAAGLSIVPTASHAGHLGGVALCTSGLVAGAAAALLGPAERSLVADLADLYVAGGGRVGPAGWLAWQDLAHRVSMIFAPPAAALAISTVGPEPLLWGETVVIAAAALAFMGVPGRRSAPDEGPGPVPGQPSAAVMAVLRAHPQIASGVLMAGAGGLCWFGFTLGLAVLGVEHGMPGMLVAAGMSGYGAASVVTSLLVPVVIDRLPRMMTMLASWAVLGATFVALPAAAPSVAGVAALAGVGGCAMPWAIAALNALISEQTSGAERRAAFTIETVLHSGGTSVGLLVGGALIGVAGSEAVLLTAGLVQMTAAVVGAGWAWRLHRRRSAFQARDGVARQASRDVR